MKDFLSHYITLQKGNVEDEAGKVIGTHDGALYYTLGQRHGFEIHTSGVHETPHYVVGKDIDRNVLIVSTTQKKGETKGLMLEGVVLREGLQEGDEIEAQFRYRQKPFPVRVTGLAGSRGTLEVLQDIETPSSGQSVVLYKGTLCIGGGIIV